MSADNETEAQPSVLTVTLFDDYRARGLALCRIPVGEKNPNEAGWPLNPRQSVEDFANGQNVGMICGPLSARRMTVDLDFNTDDVDAWDAADAVLPDTGEIDGRPGKPRAHRNYIITDSEWPDSILPKPGGVVRGAMDAEKLPRFAGTRHWTRPDDPGVARRNIDLLGAGAQVVIPPSLHESGARRAWFGGEQGEPARVTYGELLAAVEALAARLGLKVKKSDTAGAQAPPPDHAALSRVPLNERTRRLGDYLKSVKPRQHGKNENFHAQQFRIACVCCELGVPIDDARPLYEAWNQQSATRDPAPENLATLKKAYATAVFGARLVSAKDAFGSQSVKEFDEAALVTIAELADSDANAAVAMVYASADALAALSNSDFATVKLRLKDILGTALDRNALGTIRTEAQKKLRADKAKARSSALGSEVLFLDRADPMKAARAFIDTYYRCEGAATIQRHAGEFWVYEGTHYEVREPEWMRSRIYPVLDAAKTEGKDGPEDYRPTASNVDNVLDALRSLPGVFVEAPGIPCWVGKSSAPFGAADAVAFRNGILDRRRWLVSPNAPLIPHTPLWFSPYSLPFDYVSNAACPTWERCMAQWFDGDAESIESLAMWFGLLLTSDTSLQKMLVLLGPPRSGKGTIGRVLRALLGPQNVTSPTLNSLAGEFGLAPLVGKPLAFIGDAHVSARLDSAVVLDRLKGISGEDAVTINRKHRDAVTVRLPTRFVICLNRMVDFPDASGALAARLILIKTRVSFVGQEDLDLDAKLEAELPGVACWALRGLASLRQRGSLLQPASSRAEIAEFKRASSPIGAFIDDYCRAPAHGGVDVDALYRAWVVWCHEEGHQAGSKQTFGSKLQAACPGVRVTRARVGDIRIRRYEGIGLNPEGALASATPFAGVR